MKKFLLPTFFLLFSFVLFSSFGFAQGTEQDQNIWSKVNVDPNAGEYQVDPNYKYDENSTRAQYYNFGENDAVVSPNQRIKPTTNTTQSEMSIDIHPTNPSVLFAGANATNWPVSTVYGTGVYWTTNSGIAWTGFDNPPFGGNSGDPANVIGTNGYFYVGYISAPGGQGVSRSTNNGANWTSYTVAPNPGSLADKNHLMIDKKVGSPYENYLYAVWTDFGGVNDYDVVVKRSTDLGVTWSAAINLSNSQSAYLKQGANVQTGPNGEVYVTWAVYATSPVTNGEDGIGFAKSTDGGVTWSAPTYVYQATNFGIRGNLFATQIRVSSFPSMAVDKTNGNIYIVWPQRGVTPAGTDPDIVMVKSTDGGTTWTAPVRVNNDAVSNGKFQYYPWCTVDQSSGRLDIVFFDNRHTTNDSAGVWMAVSYDAGGTFDNFKVSDANFRPKPISGLAGGYQGDYIGIASADGKAYPLWADDRTGIYQGWFAEVSIGPPCPVTPASNPTPASGTTGVPINLSQISWTNGAGSTQCEVWFGPQGNVQQVYNGPNVTSYNIPATLDYNTTYSWYIISKNDTCSVGSSFWSFVTEQDPNLICFTDDFESGTGNWTIVVNAGGSPSCPWEIYLPPYPNTYQMPATSSGGVFAVDTDDCNGTTGNANTTATLTNSFDFSQFQTIVVEFDNDWNVIDAQDCAYVEVSTDSVVWTAVWSQCGTDIRGTHEVIDISTIAALEATVWVRLRSVQPGWDWYWVVDNFQVCASNIIPVELTSFTASVNEGIVSLNWSTATELNNQGFEVERRSEFSEFTKIGFVAGYGTTTETRSYTFTDDNVGNGKYYYRLKQMDFDGTIEYSNTVEVDVDAPVEYSLEQNYPNPFNPVTLVKYSVAKDGFVNVSVFNALGQKVATLVNQNQPAGRYEVSFDASKLSSGVYFYSIESGDFTSVKKMMLMK